MLESAGAISVPASEVVVNVKLRVSASDVCIEELDGIGGISAISGI